MAATNIEVWQEAEVTGIADVADGIKRIELAPQLPKRAEPGSHIDLKVQINAEDAKRSYSVVESSARRNNAGDQRTQGSALPWRIGLYA